MITKDRYDIRCCRKCHMSTTKAIKTLNKIHMDKDPKNKCWSNTQSLLVASQFRAQEASPRYVSLKLSLNLGEGKIVDPCPSMFLKDV